MRDDLRRRDTAHAPADGQWFPRCPARQEPGGIGIARAGRVHKPRRFRRHSHGLIPAQDHAARLGPRERRKSHIRARRFGRFLEGVFLVEAGDFRLVGEQNVHMARDQIAERLAMAAHAERIRQRQRHLAARPVRRRRRAPERHLRRGRIEQIAFQIGHRRGGDQFLVHIRFPEGHAGPEIGVHRPLPVGRDQDQASRGGCAAGQPRRGEMHPLRAHVVREHLAKLVVRDLAEIRDPRAKRGGDGAGIAGGTAATFGARRHRGIQCFRRFIVHQDHRALVHAVP